MQIGAQSDRSGRVFAVMLSFAVAFGTRGAAPVRAAEITIFLNQATASGVRELAAGFEKTTGHKVDVSFQAGGRR
jgi:ABC-type molybdate transport system substrate-binding protein